MAMTASEFIKNETDSSDMILFQAKYADIVDDLIGGLMLSQIVYWFLPDKKGKSKLRVKKQGKLWLAKTRESWGTFHINPQQASKRMKKLVSMGLIEIKKFKFDGAPTTHIFLNFNVLTKFINDRNSKMELIEMDTSILSKEEVGTYQNDNIELIKTITSLTKTTAETTAETTNKDKPDKSGGAKVNNQTVNQFCNHISNITNMQIKTSVFFTCKGIIEILNGDVKRAIRLWDCVRNNKFWRHCAAPDKMHKNLPAIITEFETTETESGLDILLREAGDRENKEA